MSASQDKKRRQNERSEGVDKRSLAEREAAIKAKKEKTKWRAITAVFLVLTVIILLISSPLLYTVTKSITIGDYSYTNAEFQFFYNRAYSVFASQTQGYTAYLIDTTKDLDDQEVNASTLAMFGIGVPESLADEETFTWEDFFKANAFESMKFATVMYDKAVKDGYTLSEESAAEIEEEIEALATGAETYNLGSADKYASLAMGKGVSTKTVREMLERMKIASIYAEDYYQGLEYTSEELSTYYAENKANLDKYSFTYYYAVAEKEAVEVDVTDEETGEVTKGSEEQVTDATMADAKELADNIAEMTKDSGFDIALEKYTDDANASEVKGAFAYSLGDMMREWITDSSRKEGDVTVIENEGAGYYVLRFGEHSDNNYDMVAVRHILVKAVDEDEDSSYSAEEKAAAKEAIEKIYAQWKAGDATEDSFAALANEKSEDTGSNGTSASGSSGGLYEDIYKNRMVDEFNDFCFAEGRKAGDTGIVYGESSSYAGYHLIYFVGEEDETFCDYLAQYGNGGSGEDTGVTGLRNAEYTTWQAETLASCDLKINSFVLWFAKI